jgi:hypothetical protein
VEREAQLGWEQRFGPIAAGAAFLAAVLLMVGLVLVQTVVLADAEQNDRSILLAIDGEPGALVASSIAQALSYIGVGVVLWYLFKATRHRRPEVPGWLLVMVLVGPLLLSVAAVLGALDRVDVAEEFAAGEPVRGGPGEKRAEELIDDRNTAGGLAGFVGSFTFAIALVLVSIHAMRAGLLSRFIGILGAVIGFILVVLPVPGIREVLQIFWLGSLAALFLGRWPGGRGPAWASGRAEPWPTAAQRAVSGTQDSVDRRSGVPESLDVDAPVAGEGEPAPARRSSRKRKRRS